MRHRKPIQIVPYDDNWPDMFEHIGSTAVPGVATGQDRFDYRSGKAPFIDAALLSAGVRR